MIAIRKTAATIAFACAAIAFAPLPAQPQPQAHANLEGIWDVSWRNGHGAQRTGYLRFEQQGETLRAEIHARSSVNARGTVRGRAFELRGSRMMIPYRVEGQVDGNRIQGVFRAMSVERRFSGTRRSG